MCRRSLARSLARLHLGRTVQPSRSLNPTAASSHSTRPTHSACAALTQLHDKIALVRRTRARCCKPFIFDIIVCQVHSIFLVSGFWAEKGEFFCNKKRQPQRNVIRHVEAYFYVVTKNDVDALLQFFHKMFKLEFFTWVPSPRGLRVEPPFLDGGQRKNRGSCDTQNVT